jgi:hypothetical protein
MKSHELLSRGTAFCLLHNPQHSPSSPPPAAAAAASASSSNNLVLVTCSHVVAPYRWRSYFKESWLEFVKDAHIECQVQLWSSKKKAFKHKILLRTGPPTYHPTLDLCAWQLDEKESALRDVMTPLECRLDSPPTQGEDLTFMGFPIDGDTNKTHTHTSGDSSMDVRGLHRVGAQALDTTIRDKEGRYYAKTEERLAIGMSGGPVLDNEGRCCGLFQGILPRPPSPEEEDDRDKDNDLDPILRPLQDQDWERHAGYIPIKSVKTFIDTL